VYSYKPPTVCLAVSPAGRCLQHHHTGSTPGVQLTQECVQRSSGNYSNLLLRRIQMCALNVSSFHIAPWTWRRGGRAELFHLDTSPSCHNKNRINFSELNSFIKNILHRAKGIGSTLWENADVQRRAFNQIFLACSYFLRSERWVLLASLVTPSPPSRRPARLKLRQTAGLVIGAPSVPLQDPGEEGDSPR